MNVQFGVVFRVAVPGHPAYGRMRTFPSQAQRSYGLDDARTIAESVDGKVVPLYVVRRYETKRFLHH